MDMVELVNARGEVRLGGLPTDLCAHIVNPVPQAHKHMYSYCRGSQQYRRGRGDGKRVLGTRP